MLPKTFTASQYTRKQKCLVIRQVIEIKKKNGKV